MYRDDYFPAGYQRDANALCGRNANCSLSICSFLPDYPDVPFFRDAAAHLKELGDRTSFICAMFWEVLCDQATYTLTRRDLTRYSWPGPAAKLVGLLGTMQTNLHPGFLLIALSFDHKLEPNTVSEIIRRLGSTMLVSFRESVTAESDAIASHMHASLGAGIVPDSIKPYVPGGDRYRHQPNWISVAIWAAQARETLATVFSSLANDGLASHLRAH